MAPAVTLPLKEISTLNKQVPCSLKASSLTDIVFAVAAPATAEPYIVTRTFSDPTPPEDQARHSRRGGVMWRLAVLAVVVVGALASPFAQAETLEWVEQFGTRTWDSPGGASADGLGSFYISGQTAGSLGDADAGGQNNDAFLSKYDASGTLQWTQQLHTSESESSFGVSADGLGSVYISGRTRGSLGGGKRRESGCISQQVRRDRHTRVDPAARHQ